MSIDSKTEGYLAQQYLKAEAELQGVKERSSTAEQQAAQYYPAVEQAALKVKQKLANFVDQRIKEIHAKARQEAFLKSLSLSPLFVNKGILLLVWGILIFICLHYWGNF